MCGKGKGRHGEAGTWGGPCLEPGTHAMCVPLVSIVLQGFLKHIIIRSATPHSKPSAGSDSDSGGSGHSSSHSSNGGSSSGSDAFGTLASSKSGDGSLGVADTGAPSTGVNSVGVVQKEYLVVLVTTADAPQQLKPLVHAAVKCVPQVWKGYGVRWWGGADGGVEAGWGQRRCAGRDGAALAMGRVSMEGGQSGADVVAEARSEEMGEVKGEHEP